MKERNERLGGKRVASVLRKDNPDFNARVKCDTIWQLTDFAFFIH